ncbi:PDZ and LIM domain protein Zasp isoform X6 [Musca domestica]|uniref:PDZ and LIM domain protein Zasp isoform X6 n=1 Tax=Musca domestica TaxID=7370 RepID=A0A9J7DBL8_MUSDO|nr:PDZ and LIM domain protein Zasp isoform X6 [Musca domestica]
MAQPQMMQIKLSRFDAQPWGFRLQGGTDFAQPLLVQKVNGGSLAEQAGLLPGDAVIKINDVDVFNLRHKEAQDIVVRSGNNFVMTVQRGGSTWRPHVQPTGNVPQPNQSHLQTVTKTSLAHKQQDSQHIGCGYNNAAKPFGNTVDGNVKSIVNKQYNTPVGIYSDESIAETLSAQAEVLAGGVLGVNFKKNEKEYQADKSEVLKFLREEESGTSTPEPPSATSYYATKSHAIGGNERRTPLPHDQDERIGTPLHQNTLAPAASHRPSLPTPAPAQKQQQQQQQQHQKVEPPAAAQTVPDQPDPRLIVMPVCPALQTPEYKEEMEKAAAAAAAGDSDQPKPYTASGHPACSMCGVGIVGVFVRIKDKNLHVECFKCATCGTSLKNQGYYNFNNKLYCDIHAKLAAMQNPPPGTDGYVPVPIKPNTKLSASTITSALSAHGFNGVSNGNSTPTPAPVAPQQQQQLPTTTTATPPSSNLPIVDKSLINSDNTKNASNSNIICNNNTNNNPENFNTSAVTNDMSSTMASSRPSISEQSASNGVGGSAGDKPFEYVTLTGNVIRSVVPPGKGTNVNYKVNQGYARPYGAPPAAAPKSPVTFPPQPQQWNAPPPTQPKPTVPAGNPYATLPRSNVGQGQEEAAEEVLQPQYAETSYFEEDFEVERANRQVRSNFCWPPQQDDHRTPTAAPLYIAPPETQHVEVKPIENPPPPETGERRVSQQQQQQQAQAQAQAQAKQQQQQQQQSQSQWQSRSAPQLTAGVQSTECESGSDSYTSTSTTATTTTSDDYQRMYAAQAQAYQMQQLYEQSGSEFDYHMDMEVASMQQSHDHLQLSSSEYISGRRSAQECVETLVPSLSTYKLVDMVREVTPSPVPQPTSSQGPRRVVFQDEPEVKVVDTPTQQVQQQQLVQKQQQSSSYASNLTQATTSSYTAYENVGTTSTKLEAREIIEETAEELEHSEVIFPPPSPLSHLKQKTSSGLHRPENIPKYQRNWTVLPSQSPVRTPEPHELRENVPLAFVDTPKTPTSTNGQSNENTVHKPVAQMSTRSSTAQQQSSAHASAYSSNITSTHSEQRQQQQQQQHQTASASTHTSNARQQNKPTAVPIIIEDRSGPVTMAFQSLDEHVVRDHSQPPSRPYTPSRPAPIVPAYQTPEKLCFDECPATHARAYDARSASPFPDRARSPAPGPPPNPLAAIRAPRLKENEVSSLSPRVLQAGSITTGQSYLGAQQAQKQERMLSHTETSSQSGMQSYSHQPEKREEYQVGNLSVQRREQSSRMAEQQQSQMQSQTTTQVGNTQIERRRKVTEEYEHTSSAKTVEIRTGSQTASTERRQSYGKGFVANQARRLSGLEQEITNLTPQSQAISARAATLTETKFPELDSPEPAMVAKFPTKPILPPHDEPQAPSYVVSGAACRSLANTSSSYQQEQKLSSVCGSSMVSTQQQQQQHHQLQQQQQQQKSLTTYSSVSSSQQQQQVNTVSSSLTKASATTLTNNQAYKSITAGTNQNATSTTATTAASASAPLGVCPVTGTFCRPGHTCCKQQTMQLNNNVSNGAAYRPNASLGSGNASNNAASSQQQQQQQSQRQQPQQQMQSAPKQAPAPAPAPTAAASASTNLSTPSSNVGGSNDSAGGLAPKGGAYGATSAPKRGRGIMNKPVAAGVRVPLCHSCSTQIRGPFITALGKIWCPEHFHCVNANCRRPLQDIGFVEEKGDLYCEYCFEKYLAPSCSKCGGKIKGDCLNAIGKHFHPECFSCGHCGKLFGNTPFFLEDGMPYCEADWNELFTTKCFACGFPVEAGDRWVEALNHNYHSQCFNCTYCKQNLEGQSFYNKGGRPFCKNHAR